MGKERNPRDVDVHEIVEMLQHVALTGVPSERTRKAGKLIEKLVGPERESESRWSSRHIVVDEEYCNVLADSLAVAPEECYDWFIGEPVKRVEKVAAWALEQADKTLAGLGKDYEPDPESSGPMVHGQRGRMVADMLQDWAIVNSTGVYRAAALGRQATPIEEGA